MAMPYQTLKSDNVDVKVFVQRLSDVESQALTQLRNTANLPWVLGVSAMPDVHYGKGATVGSVIVQRDALSPAVVGVDIGCGMAAVKTPLKISQLDGKLHQLRSAIEAVIPVGMASNDEISSTAKEFWSQLGDPSERVPEKIVSKARHQLGSLGGGNHFIEICRDAEDDIWIMLHSGSRNIGKEIAEFHIHKAKNLMGVVCAKFGCGPIDPDLAALVVGTKEYQEYLDDLFWAQRFAQFNRNEMMLRVIRETSKVVFGDVKSEKDFTLMRVDCHHNYISKEDTSLGKDVLVTRKGAVSAKLGELGIIPGSMGAKSYIVRGLGSADSFNSCSHGAGRKMSRGQAKRTFTLQDLQEQTNGVECRKDRGVLDEIPGAYKNIDAVMANQADLVEPIACLNQLLCVKG